MAATLLPAIRSVRTGIQECGPRVSSGHANAKWPPWKGTKRSRHQQQHQPQQLRSNTSVERSASACLAQLDGDWLGRTLKQHDTNETGMPQEDDEVISLTETWADSAANEGVSKSTKKHSRKPRTGRRAKARARLEEFYCQRACVANSVGNESSSLAPLGFLTALIEGMEEDSLEDHAQLLARGGSHVDSVPKDTDENSVSSCGQSEEASDADLVVPQNAANSIQPFEVRLFKRTGASLGVAFNIVRDGLLVSWVGDEGLAGIWNGICDVEMQLRNGDKVIGSNGSSDPKLMLESFSRLGAHRLQVLRGPFDPELPETQMPPAW